MARVKLILPQKISAQIKIPVRITDINYGNHLGNDSLVSILHEARAQWLRNVDLNELDCDGSGLIMADLAIEFKAECFYGDELNIEISIGEISRVGFELYYKLINQHGQITALAKTGMLCYDYTQKVLVSIPLKLQQFLAV